MYRIGGRQVRETLGTLARIPRVDEARRLALPSLEKVRAGVNPVAERRAAAAAEARRDIKTFAAVADRFVKEHVERNCRPLTIAAYCRQINRDLIRAWGTRPIREITKGDVNDLLDRKAERFLSRRTKSESIWGLSFAGRWISI